MSGKYRNLQLINKIITLEVVQRQQNIIRLEVKNLITKKI